jgi:glycerol dehydrogenase-like iron-containing ADH family enzyme
MISAKEWVAHYGTGVIRQHTGQLDDYIAFTSPSAWAAVEPHMAHPPRAVEFIRSQEMDYSEALAARMDRARHAVGIGGGRALDAAKIVAERIGAELVLIPTIVSSGAIFQPHYPGREAGKLTIVSLDIFPQFVLFDTDVIRAAPPHLTASGMGETVCWVATIASWKWWADQGREGTPPWDQTLADAVIEWVAERTAGYAQDLDDDGRPGEQAIRVCAEALRERYDLPIADMKVGHEINHLLDNTFVWVHRRDLLHGETVALGTLLDCHLYASCFDEARGMLDACRMRYRPSQIGCTWAEIRAVLEAIPAHCDFLGWPKTCLHDRPIDDATFDQMVSRVEADS